jgi:predicted porin
MEAAVHYSLDSFAASATYSQTNGSVDSTTGVSNSSSKDVRAALGASYKFGKLTVYGGYENISGSLQLTPHGDTYFAGAGYMFTPFLKLTGEVYRYDFGGSNGSATGYVSSFDYFVSKSTTVYVNVGFVNNRNGSNFGLNPYTTTANGQSQFGTNVGLLHTF